MKSTFIFLQDMPEIFTMPITLALIVVTGLTSYQAFSNPELRYKLIFNASIIKSRKEWYRFWSHGLIHADWLHLGLNVFVLYEFGANVEKVFNGFYLGLLKTAEGVAVVPHTYQSSQLDFTFNFGVLGSFLYLLLYGLGLAAASIYSYYKHQNNYGYNALGASGAVSGIVFAYILIFPTNMLYLFGIVPMPAIVMGIAYLVYSHYMGKKGTDNIGHDAHFWGAVWGAVFMATVDLVFNQAAILKGFIYQLTYWV